MLRNTILILSFAALLALGSDDQSKFAPFGTAAGDTALPKCDDCFAQIPYSVLFYGTRRSNIYLYNNGIYGFDQNPYTNVVTPSSMSAINISSVAIFLGDVDTRPGQYGGNVYYRISTDSTLLSHWSSQVPASNFQGSSAFIATWDHVGHFYSDIQGQAVDTFQSILITDGSRTYAFFNYGQLQWASGASDSGFGSGGNAVVGATVGDHVHFYQAPLSGTNNIVNITDFVILVSGCGDGIVGAGEQCDGGPNCTASCTFARPTAQQFCSAQGLPNGQVGYYCNADGGFYQCVGGSSAPQSRSMTCAAGTRCGCGFGQECSCNLSKSPCVTAGSSQTC